MLTVFRLQFFLGTHASEASLSVIEVVAPCALMIVDKTINPLLVGCPVTYSLAFPTG